jgi:hypothetical protein
MTEYNLKSFLDISEVDITNILGESNILILHILHWYYIIRDWYISKKSIKIKLKNTIVENKDYINNEMELINISNLTYCDYCSIIYNESSIYSSLNSSCLEHIKNMYLENILYNALYIVSDSTKYIVFNFSYHNRIILINVSNLNIIEFKSIEECIDNVNKITKNKYKYQILRIIKRLYNFDKT